MTTHIRNYTRIVEAEDIPIGDFVPGDALVFNAGMDGLVPLRSPASLEGLTDGVIPYVSAGALADSIISISDGSAVFGGDIRIKIQGTGISYADGDILGELGLYSEEVSAGWVGDPPHFIAGFRFAQVGSNIYPRPDTRLYVRSYGSDPYLAMRIGYGGNYVDFGAITYVGSGIFRVNSSSGIAVQSINSAGANYLGMEQIIGSYGTITNSAKYTTGGQYRCDGGKPSQIRFETSNNKILFMFAPDGVAGNDTFFFQPSFGITPDEISYHGHLSDGSGVVASSVSATLSPDGPLNFLGIQDTLIADYAAPAGRLAMRHEATGTGTETTIGQSKLTEIGGICIKMVNKTGAASVRGTIVSVNAAVDGACEVAAASAYDAIGVMYSVGVADGSDVWVVISGVAQVLLKDTTASIRDGWVGVSDVAGRANASAAVPSPPTDAIHFQEIGHCIEAQAAGTAVLAKVILHFN